MRKQGLRDGHEIEALQRMLSRRHRGMHVQAVHALAPLRGNFEVEVAYNAQVHTQILHLSGSGVMDLYGSKEVQFTQLDHLILLQEVHRELLQEWRHNHPPMRAHGPTLFTAASALLQGDTDHLMTVPEGLRAQAEEAVKLYQQYEQLEKAHLDTPEDEQDHQRFDQEACRISVELTRMHLIPELLRLDPALDQVFFAHTGDHLLDMLSGLHFMGGDSGGYTDLEAKHKGVYLNLADEQPSYPRLFDVALSLKPESAGQEYQVVVTETSLHVNTP